MDESDTEDMVKRFVWLTGALTFGISLARLGRLLQPQVNGPAWQVVLAAAAVLGFTFTWAARSYRLSVPASIAANLAGISVAALRIMAPSTVVLGVLPSAETFATVAAELSFAWDTLRYGSAPVLPVAGLVAVMTVVYWVIGATAAVGVTTDRPILVTVPSLAFYLQLATLDRRRPGIEWLLAFVVIAGMVVISLSSPGDATTGKLRARSGMLIPRVSLSLAMSVAGIAAAVALGASTTIGDAVPDTGTIQWRTRTGIGSGLYGGSSFNLFAGMQRGLVADSEDPVFYATVSESAPPNSELYWRLITLSAYDGEFFVPANQDWERNGIDRFEREDLTFTGPTVPVAALVQVAGLREVLLPTIGSPYRLTSEIDLIGQSFEVAEEGAIGIDVRTAEGWRYEFEADVPRPDIEYLASEDGQLSPLFQEAADQGIFSGRAQAPVASTRPEDIDDYLETADTPREVSNLARTVTTEGTTDFERAVLLEDFLRDESNDFTYSTDVDLGHSTEDLASWLLDVETAGYRAGYCEQFATAMAVMARTLGIPSRVVLGFTPGEVTQQSDGTDVIVVRERNAHAWTELWMDGQGWVPFDPTPRSDGINPSRAQEVGFDLREYVPPPEEIDETGTRVTPTGARPLIDELIDLTPGDPTPDLRADEATPIPRWVWLLILIVLGASAAPAWKFIRRRRRLAAIRTGDIDAAWAEIVDRLTDLRAPVPAHETPLEIATRHHEDLVPLARLYSASAYGGKPRGDGRVAFASADARVTRRYSKSERLRAALRFRSLR